AVRLEMRLALQRRLGAVGRGERDALRAEVRKRPDHAAEGGEEVNAARALEAPDQLRLAFLAQRIAHRGVRHDDDRGLHHGKERHVLVEVLDLAAVALLLPRVRARLAVRHHAREVHRHARRREADHLRLDGRVAGWNEEAEPNRGQTPILFRRYGHSFPLALEASSPQHAATAISAKTIDARASRLKGDEAVLERVGAAFGKRYDSMPEDVARLGRKADIDHASRRMR